MESHSRLLLMESRIWDLHLDTLTRTRLCEWDNADEEM